MKQIVFLIAGLMTLSACMQKSGNSGDSREILRLDESKEPASHSIGQQAVGAKTDRNRNIIEEKGPDESDDLVSKISTSKALNAEVKKIQSLNRLVNVSLVRKGFFEARARQHFVFQIDIENKSSRNIKTVDGMLQVSMPGGWKKIIRIHHDKGVVAGSTIRERINVDYNELAEEDQLLKSLELTALDVDWLPEKIIFLDGSVLPASF